MLRIYLFCLQILIISTLLESKDLSIPPQSPAESDIITSLPNVTFEVKFKQYSGYLNVSKQHQLHYWLVESQRNPEKDPVLLWLNGGPGCSSLFGFLGENGPFRLDWKGENLIENIHSWNKFANVLYLESPAVVGFSHATEEHPHFSDSSVAKENHIALQAFVKKFPNYNNRKFFMSGESYAGVYIPSLAVEILKNPKFPMKFEGVAIGNGIYDGEINANTQIDFLFSHGIFGDTRMSALRKACNCSNYMCDYYKKDSTEECGDLRGGARSAFRGSPYNIYDSCYDDDKFMQTPSGPVRVSYLPRYISPLYTNRFSKVSVIYPGHCNVSDGNVMNKYLNNATVRKALHIPDYIQRWKGCAGIYYDGDLIAHTMRAQFKIMLKANLNVLLYTGDFDFVCSFLQGQGFLSQNLHLNPKGYRKNWLYTQKYGSMAAGYWDQYHENLDFLTVRGAGHFVPTDKPREALQMIGNFLAQNRDFSKPVK